MSLKSLRNEYNEFVRKAYTEGVTRKDYYALKDLKKEVGTYDFDNSKVRSLFYDIKKLCEAIYAEGIAMRFLPNNVQYIRANADLLPIVINHNDDGEEFFFYGDNGFLLPMRFSKKDPIDNEIVVKDLLNQFYTTGNNIKGSAPEFLEAITRKNKGECLELLCYIYGFKIPFIHDDIKEKADEYKAIITGDGYRYMLESARKRLVEERKIIKYNGASVIEQYDRKFATIERIKNGKEDPGFIYKKPPETIVLKPKK